TQSPQCEEQEQAAGSQAVAVAETVVTPPEPRALVGTASAEPVPPAPPPGLPQWTAHLRSGNGESDSCQLAPPTPVPPVAPPMSAPPVPPTPGTTAIAPIGPVPPVPPAPARPAPPPGPPYRTAHSRSHYGERGSCRREPVLHAAAPTAPRPPVAPVPPAPVPPAPVLQARPTPGSLALAPPGPVPPVHAAPAYQAPPPGLSQRTTHSRSCFGERVSCRRAPALPIPAPPVKKNERE
ncbi:unnamed protein product, partial [Closterium sp. NIES-54]